MNKLEKLSPFKHFCMTIGNLPTSYLESMSYYETILWLIKYLENTVIPTINNNTEVTEEIQSTFTQLVEFVNNYFDNLDVQDEINNKLDEMVEDGTFDTIINQTLFTEINDKIEKRICYTSDFRETYVDDDVLLSYCLSGDFDIVYIDNNLNLTSAIQLPSNIMIINQSTVTADKSRIFYASNKENITLIGGKYATTDNDTVVANSYQPIVISNCKNVNISNCEISTQSSDGLYLGVAYSENTFDLRTENVKIENCKFKNCARNGIVINSGDNININNCSFENINTYNPGHGIDVEFEYSDTSNALYVTNLNVTNCYAKNCNTLINIYPTLKMANKSSINVNNCTCDDVKIIVHGPGSNADTLACNIEMNNIIFKNMTTPHNIRIAEFRNPNSLVLSNIYTEGFIGSIPGSLAEFGDIFIDGNNYAISNITINNVCDIGSTSRNQTIVFKDGTNSDVKIYNTKIKGDTKTVPFKTKYINCSGYLDAKIPGSNAWFKVMELPDYCKINFNIFSTTWLNVDIKTSGATDTLTVTKEIGSTYISQARIVKQNNQKYLEFYTTRLYSFPLVYDCKIIENGIDKKPSDAVEEDVTVEVNVTSA